MFQFDSIDAFFTMAGHGSFVWTAYGISIALMLWLIVNPLRRKHQLLKQIARDLRREEAQLQQQYRADN
jgi:heme exporter protein D